MKRQLRRRLGERRGRTEEKDRNSNKFVDHDLIPLEG